MRNKGSKPAAVKKFETALAGMGCVITGDTPVLHHVLGEKARSNKFPIGYYWMVPMRDDIHKYWHADRTGFIAEHLPEWIGSTRFGPERHMFTLKALRLMHMLPEGVMTEIVTYHR